jgi:hypothetical protein
VGARSTRRNRRSAVARWEKLSPGTTPKRGAWLGERLGRGSGVDRHAARVAQPTRSPASSIWEVVTYSRHRLSRGRGISRRLRLRPVPYCFWPVRRELLTGPQTRQPPGSWRSCVSAITGQPRRPGPCNASP